VDNEQEIVVKLWDHQGYRIPPRQYVVHAWADAGVYVKMLGSLFSSLEFLRNEQFVKHEDYHGGT
jgi:hypothetical protein